MEARARLAVLSIAADVAVESLVADLAIAAGHEITAFDAVRDSETAIRAQLLGWIEDPAIDVVIVVGKGEATRRAVQPMVEEVLPGFEELAVAVWCGSTRVFVLPPGEAAARAGLDRVFAARLRADTDTSVDISVPSAIPAEKTAAGAGLVPRLPAVAQRSKSRTGANVVERKVEDPTKPIELDKLEQQLELSAPRDGGTKPIELAKLEKQLALSAVEDATKRVVPATTPRPLDPTKPIELATPPRSAGIEKPIGIAKPVQPVKRVEPTRPASPSRPIELATPRPVEPKPLRPLESSKPATPSEVATARPAERAKPSEVATAVRAPRPLDEPAPIELTKRKQAPTAELARLPARPPGADPEVELDERDLVTTPEPAPVRAARTRPPTPPPPSAARISTLATPEPAKAPELPSPPPLASAVGSARLSEPTLPVPPSATSSVLDAPIVYPTLRSGSKAPFVIAFLVLAAIAGGVVWYTTRDDSQRAVEVAQTTAPRPDAAIAPADVAAPAPDADVAVAEPADASVAVAEPVDAEVAVAEPPADAAVAVPVKRAPPPRRSPKRRDTAVVADAKPAEAAKPVEPPPKPETPVPRAEPGCEEVTCVMEKYARPCCARFKPKDDAFTPTVGASDSLTKPQIRAGVGTVKAAVIACGERFPVKGTVRLAISVDGEGSVQSVDVQASPDDALGSCVAGVVRKAHFAKTTEGGSFTYPFVF